MANELNKEMLEKIKKGIQEADAGMFASDEEVIAFFDKWTEKGSNEVKKANIQGYLEGLEVMNVWSNHGSHFSFESFSNEQANEMGMSFLPVEDWKVELSKVAHRFVFEFCQEKFGKSDTGENYPIKRLIRLIDEFFSDESLEVLKVSCDPWETFRYLQYDGFLFKTDKDMYLLDFGFSD